MRLRAGWVTLFVPVLLIGAVAVGGLVRSRRPGARQAKSDAARPHHGSIADNDALQTTCYEQARSLYARLGYPKGRIAGYGHHYNHTFGKCFLHIVNTETGAPDATWTYERVIEAVSGTDVAVYAAVTAPKSSALGATRPRCEVRLPSNDLRVCRTEKEFADLVDVYMEEY